MSFDVYKRECLGTFLTAEQVGQIMADDAAAQLADETQRYGGRHGPYASWHVMWSEGDSGKGWLGELDK